MAESDKHGEMRKECEVKYGIFWKDEVVEGLLTRRINSLMSSLALRTSVETKFHLYPRKIFLRIAPPILPLVELTSFTRDMLYK